jgi:phosphatidylglycerol:prolipoprotein diacylglycerol transferase
MHDLVFIIWNFDPELYSGTPTIRWYGLLFALGFLLSQQVLFYVFKVEAGNEIEKKKNAEKLIENFTVYMIIATIVGARLGHVLFYQPMDYITDPIRILNIREGGLASHGAFFGLFIGVLMFTKYRFNIKQGSLSKLFFIKTNRGYTFFQILDRLVIVVALTGALIRMGNFANSEIIGKPTNSDYGVVFAREATDYLTYDPTGSAWIDKVDFRENPDGVVNEKGHVPIYIYVQFKNRTFKERQLINYLDNGLNTKFDRLSDHIDEPLLHNLDYELLQTRDGTYTARVSTFAIPRHPAQLYESLTTFLLFLLIFYLWSRKKKDTLPGSLFGLLMILLFTMRFFHEFLKENQVAFEDNLTLNMGQWLSIPFVLGGAFLIFRALKKPEVHFKNG